MRHRPCAMTRLPLPSLAVAAAVLLAACSSTGASGVPTASPTSPASLDGRTFLSTALEGAILVPGTQVRLTFADRQLNAHGGCNMMGGSYTIDGNRIRTTQMFMTEMACDELRGAQDEWLSSFLADARFTLDGDTLTMTDGTALLTLMDEEVVTPDQPLEDTNWVVDGIVSGDTVSSVPVGVTASIRIAGGQAEVKAGCNSGGGTVAVTADKLSFGPIALTKMACEAGAMSVEAAVVAVLSGDVAYVIDADTLTLDAGGAGLILRAAR